MASVLERDNAGDIDPPMPPLDSVAVAVQKSKIEVVLDRRDRHPQHGCRHRWGHSLIR